LAGQPQYEYWGIGRDQWLSEFQSPAEHVFGDFSKFLDEIGNFKAPFLPLPHSLSGAWFGIFSYELGRDLLLKKHPGEGVPARKIPDFYFFKPSKILAFNRQSREWYFWGPHPFSGFPVEKNDRHAFKTGALCSRTGIVTYKDWIKRAQAYISAGDIYQANLAQTYEADWSGEVGSLYRLLKEMNPAPFMGIFKTREATVVSSSPERLIKGEGDWLETKPIAGTRPRGGDPIGDLQMKWELNISSKEQAEHLMLVDLARNDLGRVAEFGTVNVKDYGNIESYAKVHHLVSIVKARRNSNFGFSEILKSMFPAGTITGCPKMRCMEIIEELEKCPRGYYTGSMGYVAPGPCFDLNILIRSFTVYDNGTLEFRAGAGIVADSDPDREYLETLFKVEALAQSLGTSLLRPS
jgi:anthranilate synthase component 1